MVFFSDFCLFSSQVTKLVTERSFFFDLVNMGFRLYKYLSISIGFFYQDFLVEISVE